MSRRRSTSVRLWVVAALFGLGALLPAGAAQISSIAEQQLFRKDAPALAVSQNAVLPGKESLLPGNIRQASHALPRTSTSALTSRAVSLIAPEFATRGALREGAGAIANAPRITGPSRAPPAA